MKFTQIEVEGNMLFGLTKHGDIWYLELNDKKYPQSHAVWRKLDNKVKEYIPDEPPF